jgi:HEAT repeat protein
MAAAGRARPRSAALLALALAGDGEAARLARRAMKDVSCRGNGVAALAALTLGFMGSAEDGPDLVATFADPGAPADLRSAAAVAAGLVKARDSVEAIRKTVRKTKDARVAAWGLLGLALIDGRAAMPLLEAAHAAENPDAIRRLIVIALGYAGGPKAEKLLVRSYGDNYRVNREAPPALFRLNPELALEELLKRLRDERNPWARRFAAIALPRCFELESPSPFGSVLLRTGLCVETPVTQLLLYLESGG